MLFGKLLRLRSRARRSSPDRWSTRARASSPRKLWRSCQRQSFHSLSEASGKNLRRKALVLDIVLTGVGGTGGGSIRRNLFLAEGGYGIEHQRLPRGDEARGQSDESNDRRNRRDHEGIAGAHVEQDAGDQSAAGEGARDAAGQADGDGESGLARDQRHDLRAPRA